MGADPGHATEEHDHEKRDAPDDEFDAAGIGPIGQIVCPHVGGSKPPGEGKGRGDRRDNDGEHDGERINKDRLLGNPDDSLGVEDGRLTCRQRNRGQENEAACNRGVHPTKSPQRF